MLKLILLFFIIFSLNAKEPILARLTNVVANDIQRFSIGNSSFICEVYGVVSIEKVLRDKSSNSICVNSLIDFYKKNAQLQYFTNQILEPQQRYSIEFKKDKCIIYAKGQKTLSEILLEEGLATVELGFKDKEYRYAFKKAQIRARVAKKGMWSNSIRQKCLADLIGK